MEKSDDSKDSFLRNKSRFPIVFLKYHMKNLLGDFNARVARGNIFQPTIGNESIHQGSNDNGGRIIKTVIVRSTIFPHRNVQKYTWTNGKTHNQIEHVLIDSRRHSSILDVRSFGGADCVTHLYLVVVKFWERLAVRKPATQKFDERFNYRTLNELEVRKQYQIKI